jgi:hypothetical protein
MGIMMLPDRATCQLSLVITATACFAILGCRIGWININNTNLATTTMLDIGVAMNHALIELL